MPWKLIAVGWCPAVLLVRLPPTCSTARRERRGREMMERDEGMKDRGGEGNREVN